MACGELLVEVFAERMAGRGREPLVAGEPSCTAREILDRRFDATLPPRSLVGLSAPDGPAFVAELMAIWRAGHCALLLDHAMPRAEQDRIGRRLGAAAIGDRELGGTTRLGNAAAVKLSSGSTGEPRGIAVSAEALLRDTEALHGAMGFIDGERFWSAVPWSHSYGFSLLPMSLFVRPCTLVMEPAGGPTVLPTSPAYLLAARKRRIPWPTSLRRVISAGAPLPPDCARAYRETYGMGVHVFYGASESGGITYDATGTAGERGSVGRPIPGVDVTLEDGVVTVRSGAVAGTYLPEPDDRLRDGRFRTDDVARFGEDGELYLQGRCDDWINVDGRKVNPREVEEILCQLRGVSEALVSAAGPEDEGKRVVRAVIACPDGELDYARVQAWCRERLSAYKVPRSILFVDEIPRTGRGKPDRHALGFAD